MYELEKGALIMQGGGTVSHRVQSGSWVVGWGDGTGEFEQKARARGGGGGKHS